MNSIYFVLCAILPIGLFGQNKPSHASFESTVTYELLKIDKELYNDNTEEINACKALMTDAVNRITQRLSLEEIVGAEKKTALKILMMIDSTFTEHRFIFALASQVQENQWHHFDFLTAAFRDRFSPSEFLFSSSNQYRRAFWKVRNEEQCRLIDCDLYCEIYVGIAQMLGLPISMVEIPRHNYLRWRFADGTFISWDTIHGREYSQGNSPDEEMKHSYWNKKHYLFDWSTNDIKAYYFYRRACLYNFHPKYLNLNLAKRDYETSIQLRKNDPASLCNHVWLHIMNPIFDKEITINQLMNEIDTAISQEENFNFYDAKACLYALKGDYVKAIEVGKLAEKISTGYSNRRQKAKEHLNCFKRGESCREIP